MADNIRMYEPYGYNQNAAYLSKKAMLHNEVVRNRNNDKKEFTDIETLYKKHNTEAFNSAYYDKDLESVIFKNVNGDAIGSIRMTDIIPSKLVKTAEYDAESQKMIVIFDNDDKIEVDLNELINNNEAGDGLMLDESKFSVLIASDSEKFVSGTNEPFLSVNGSGLKIDHIQDAIDVEKERALEAERVERETRIENDRILLNLINKEVQDRINDVDEEETRAKTEEKRIDDTIGTGFTTSPTKTVTYKCDELSTAIANEKSDRTSQDTQLQNKINNESILRAAEITRVENLVSSEERRSREVENAVLSALRTSTSALTDSISEEKDERETSDDELRARIIALETALSDIFDRLDEIERKKQEPTVIDGDLDGEVDDEI